MFEDFKKAMSQELEMIDMRPITYYLGIHENQVEEGVFILQEGYVQEILKKFSMFDCKPVNTPMECGAKLSKIKNDDKKIDSTMFKVLFEV